MNSPIDLKELLQLTWPGLNDRFKRIVVEGMGAVVSESVAHYILADELRKALESKKIQGVDWASEAEKGYDIILTTQRMTIIMEGKHVNEKEMRTQGGTNNLLAGLLKDLVKLCVSDKEGTKLLLATAINSMRDGHDKWPSWEALVTCAMGESERGEIWDALVSGRGMDDKKLEEYWNRIPESIRVKNSFKALWDEFKKLSPARVQVVPLIEEQSLYARLVVLKVQPMLE